MTLQFEITQGGGPPRGLYRGKFLAVEATEHSEYGEGLKFVFEVAGGEHAGEIATRITSPSPTTKNACGRMIAGISGEPLAVGAKVDLSPHVGEEFLLQIDDTQSGNGTRITSVMPAGAGGQ